jgi:hypothetical protein
MSLMCVSYFMSSLVFDSGDGDFIPETRDDEHQSRIVSTFEAKAVLDENVLEGHNQTLMRGSDEKVFANIRRSHSVSPASNSLLPCPVLQ